MANDSLTKFANVLYAEALDDKKKVADRLKQERADVLAQKDAELEARYKREVDKCRSDVRHEVRLAVSKREAELSKILRLNRAKAADEVFAAAAERLSEFAAGEKYEEYLKREIDEIRGEFGDGAAVCSARACDFDLLRRLLPMKELDFKEVSGEIIGGFTLESAALGIFADCTLKARLEEQKERFFEISGLVID